MVISTSLAFLALMPMHAPAATAFTGPRFLAAYQAPRVATMCDMNGDGHADFVGYYPKDGGIVDLSLMSSLGKLRYGAQAATGVGEDAVAFVALRALTGPAVLLILPDGSLKLLSGRGAVPGKLTVSSLSGSVPRALARQCCAAVAGDFDGDGVSECLIRGRDGRYGVLRASGPSAFAFLPGGGRIKALAVAAGDLDGDGRSEIVVLDARRRLSRARIALGESSASLADWRLIGPAPAEARVSVGRFLGRKTADVLVGRDLLPGGDASAAVQMDALPDPSKPSLDYAWQAVDLDGDGADDLVRFERSTERGADDPVRVHMATRGTSGHPWADSDGDGLLDGWEDGSVRPGGLDLPALGCRTGAVDIVVEAQRTADVAEDLVRREMVRVVAYYGTLGPGGIHLHVIHREPIPLTDAGKPWWELGERYHPNRHRGVTHWMVMTNGGGGQSSEMSDRGSCGAHALYATFIHEFGHQIGLDHTGKWGPAWCPIYPSLMNYAYSYQLGGKGDLIGYSSGRLAGVTLHEQRLDERLPLSPDLLLSVSGPPYHFRVRPAPDGKGSLVDWNWNGVFGEKGIAADINYGYSTSGGLRHTIGKTYCAPALVAAGQGAQERLIVFAGRLPEGAPVPASDAKETRHSLSSELPGRLVARVWRGSDPDRDGAKWSDEVTIAASGLTGDPSAVAIGETVWVAYPTPDGIVVQSLVWRAGAGTNVGEGMPSLGPSRLIARTKGCQPTLVRFGRGMLLLAWSGPEADLTAFKLRPAAEGRLSVDAETSLGVRSAAPVGAVEGAAGRDGRTLLVAATRNIPGGHQGRFAVQRFARSRSGAWRDLGTDWVGGDKGGERGSSRAVLLREPSRGLGPDGQLYFVACGLFGQGAPWSCHYVCTQIADKTVNGGWLTRRYYDEWTQSRSGPGACWFRGDMAFASRWFGNVRGDENDNLFVAFHGRGIESEPMGDFDDIGFIRRHGIARSIGSVPE